MSMERVNKKVSLSIFTKNAADYIIENYKNGGYIKVDLWKIQYPKPGFKAKHKPTSLTNNEKRDEDKVNTKQEIIKLCVTR